MIPLLLVSVGMAYAEPLENVQTSVLDFTNNTATVQITWDADEETSSYKIGCVSCFPNTVKSVTENSVIIGNVTSLPNSSIAMLYGLAYDLENNLLTAVQIFVNLAPIM
ncbi:MAG: hypothetical protein OEL77_03775 [Nitrosopumilus sp.]|nr:hypothetical protein [Nitrosopumilus sp.]